MREHFERTHGRIVAAHWSSREAAGVAVCCRHLAFGRLQWSLHRSMGSLASQRPEFSPLLRHVGGEAARASSVLSRQGPAPRRRQPLHAQPPRDGGAGGVVTEMADFALPAPARVHAASPARVRRPSASFGDLVHAQWEQQARTPPMSARACATRRPARRSKPSTARSSTTTGPPANPPGSRCAASRGRWGRVEWSLHRDHGEPGRRAPGVLAAAAAQRARVGACRQRPARHDAAHRGRRTSSRSAGTSWRRSRLTAHDPRRG